MRNKKKEEEIRKKLSVMRKIYEKDNKKIKD